MTVKVNFPVSHIRVAGYDMELKIWPLQEAHGAMRYGEFSSIEQCIRIQDQFSTRFKMVDTFLHEIMHAIFWVYGIGKDDDEERIVNSFGTALMTLHRDNPWLGEWINVSLR